MPDGSGWTTTWPSPYNQVEPNRVRHEMNAVVVAVGVRPAPELRPAAKRVAAAIGKVEVDHGQTGCRTPDAASYIDKVLAYRSRRTTRASATTLSRHPPG